MSYRMLFKTENDQIRERYDLAVSRIALIDEEDSVRPPFDDYFKKTAEFILLMDKLSLSLERDELAEADVTVLRRINALVYADILPENYGRSYGDPVYASKMLGKEFGPLLSALYSEIRCMSVYAWECRRVDMTLCMELFIEIYNLFETEEGPQVRQICRAMYWYISDYCDVTLAYRFREQFDASLDFITEIVMNADLSDERYLYKYGDYISDIERKHLNDMQAKTQIEIDAGAVEIVKKYINSMRENGISLSDKKTVGIQFEVGYERLVRAVVLQFKSYGLVPVMCRRARQLTNRLCDGAGIGALGANKQYDDAHRMDEVLFFSKALAERKLSVMKVTFGELKKNISEYAGKLILKDSDSERTDNVKYDKMMTEYMCQKHMLYNQFTVTYDVSEIL